MRIGLYVPVFDPRPVGVGVYVDAVCSRLVALEPDCVLFTQTPEHRPPWASRIPLVKVPSLASLVPRAASGLARRAARLAWLNTAAHLAFRRHGIDVLFSPVHEGQTFGSTPQVVVLHDLTPLHVPEAYAPAHVQETRWLLPAVLRHSRRVIAISESTKRDLMRFFASSAERVTVITEGFDRELIHPVSVAETARVRQAHRIPERYLLYAGTYSRHKNLTLLPSVLAELKDSHDVALVLAGRRDAGAAAEFDAEVKARGLEGRVVTTGYLAREDLSALMSGAAAFVFPSRYEGFGLAVLDALACGAPVVASNVASLPEVVGEAGWLVDGNDAKAWARAVEQALVVDRAVIRERAVRQAAKFDWDDAAKRIHETLRGAAG